MNTVRLVLLLNEADHALAVSIGDGQADLGVMRALRTWQRRAKNELRASSQARIETAMAWLSEQLTDGPVAVSDLLKDVRPGITLSTLRRAKKRLCVRAIRRGHGDTAAWYWALPS